MLLQNTVVAVVADTRLQIAVDRKVYLLQFIGAASQPVTTKKKLVKSIGKRSTSKRVETLKPIIVTSKPFGVYSAYVQKYVKSVETVKLVAEYNKIKTVVSDATNQAGVVLCCQFPKLGEGKSITWGSPFVYSGKKQIVGPECEGRAEEFVPINPIIRKVYKACRKTIGSNPSPQYLAEVYIAAISHLWELFSAVDIIANGPDIGKVEYLFNRRKKVIDGIKTDVSYSSPITIDTAFLLMVGKAVFSAIQEIRNYRKEDEFLKEYKRACKAGDISKNQFLKEETKRSRKAAEYSQNEWNSIQHEFDEAMPYDMPKPRECHLWRDYVDGSSTFGETVVPMSPIELIPIDRFCEGKITTETDYSILVLLNAGFTIREIASRLNVSSKTVCNCGKGFSLLRLN